MSRPEERNGAGDAHAQPTRRDRNAHQPTGDRQDVDTAQRFGRFELLLEMGRGGMATLFLSRLRGPKGFEKLVALKRIHEQLTSEAQFTEMFLDEARIAARIQHPNVANVFDMGRVDDQLYLAMEYVHGEPLNEVIRNSILQGGGLECHHALRLVADAAAGLHAAHELTSATGEPLGVVHRDVSPQNILVSYDGHVKVVDFGIAYAAERLTNTRTGTIKGKTAYMSPEQAMAKPVDRRSDIFSLGIVLWELVLGQRLFREHSESATLLRIRDGDIPKPCSVDPDVPAPVEEIILRALAHQPGVRYQTAAQLREALDRELFRQKRYVSAVQIGELMTQLCAEERRAKDQRIQMASHSAAQQLLEATDPALDRFPLQSDGTTTSPDPIPELKSTANLRDLPTKVVPQTPTEPPTEILTGIVTETVPEIPTKIATEIVTEIVTETVPEIPTKITPGQPLDADDLEHMTTRIDTPHLPATSAGHPPSPAAAPAPSSRRGLLWALGGVGAVGLAVVLFLLLRGDPDKGPAPATGSPSTPMEVTSLDPTDAAPLAPHRAVVVARPDASTGPRRPAVVRRDRVHVRVQIRPADSKPVVSLVGKRYATTRLDVWVPRARAETTLVITAAGYAQETIRISLERDTRLTVPLQRARPPRVRPRRHTGPRIRTRPRAADLVKTY